MLDTTFATTRPVLTPVPGGAPLSLRPVAPAPGPAGLLAGARVLVPGGLRRVEALRPGDAVLTADHGIQTVRGIHTHMLGGRDDNAPVFIAAGMVGNGANLLVAPGHRFVIRGDWVQRRLGVNEALVPARQLIDGTGIFRSPRAEVTYYQIRFDRHELIFAEAALCESLRPQAEAPARPVLAAETPQPMRIAV